MKKSIVTMLETFKAASDEAKTRNTYDVKSTNWNSVDREVFWKSALDDYPQNSYTDIINRMIKCLQDNELVEYSDIRDEFVEWYKDYGAGTDVGLTTFITDYIVEQAENWVYDYAVNEEDEMRENLQEELADLDEDERDEAEFALVFPTHELLDEYKQARRKCWYWEQLFGYYVKKSGFVEEVIDTF